MAKATQSPTAHPLSGESNGVRVTATGEHLLVQVPYNRVLTHIMHGVNGAQFDKAAAAWKVPLALADELAPTLARLRKEAHLFEQGREEIAVLAVQEAAARQTPESAGVPRVNDYHEKGKPLHGEIIAANGYYAAQLTGFGERDGAAFVTLHCQNELSEAVFKGQRVSITYGDGGRAQVVERETAAQRLDAHMGQEVDGVTVQLKDGHYQIDFAYNPALTARLQRVDGAAFNKNDKVWEVPADKKAFVARAVADMRREYGQEQAALAQVIGQAELKQDGLKCVDAFTREGQTVTGKILAANERFVVQHSGRDYAAIHRASALEQVPEVGQLVKVRYGAHGRATVEDRAQKKTQALER